MNDEARAALRCFLGVAGDFQDEGPDGEGWQSPQLGHAVALLREYLAAPPPHCATCRWAEREGGGGVLPLKCGRILTLDYCEIPQMLAVVLANDDAEFNVSPDFGCVMHEAKP